jgi:signal transduction histidine kinase
MQVALVVTALCWARVAGAAQPVLLTPDTAGLNLAPHLEVLRDVTTRVTFQEARAAHAAGRFKPNVQPWPQYGFTPDAIWLHFNLRSTLTERATWLVELQTARMDWLDWHEVRDGTPAPPVLAGNQRPLSAGVLDDTRPVLPVTLDPAQTVEVFLRVQSETSVHVPLRAWSVLHFTEAKSHDESLYALLLGYLLALILVSLLLSMLTRDRGFLVYSLSLVGLVVNYAINTGFYTWLRLPGGSFAVHHGALAAVHVTMCLLMVYLRLLLAVAERAPRLDRLVTRPLLLVTPVVSLVVLLLPFRPAVQLTQLQALLYGVLSMAVALHLGRAGDRVARFYFVGWLGFWAVQAWVILQYRGVVPIASVPELPVLLGITFSMTFFFVALALRVRAIRDDAMASQGRVIELQDQVSQGLRRQVEAHDQQLRHQQLLIRDLHDGIGGITANIGLMASLAQRREGPDRQGILEGIAELATQGSAELRTIMNTLEARDMQWPDLVDECRRHAELVLGAHDITLDFQVEGDTSLPGPGVMPGMSLLRVFKEAITNVVKHAGAANVVVVMRLAPERFYLTVRDDGRGVSGTDPTGRGMGNMDRRVKELGGVLSVESGPGLGLRFELPLPLPAQG